MRFVPVDLQVVCGRDGVVVHATTDPAEAVRMVEEDRALQVRQERIVLRVADTIEIA